MANFTIGTKLNETTRVYLLDIGTDDFIKTASGEKMYMEICSADSKKYRKVLASLVSENEKRRTNKKSNDEIITEVLAGCVASWNVETEDGPLPLTIQNAIDFFEANRTLRELGVESQHDRKIFLQK